MFLFPRRSAVCRPRGFSWWKGEGARVVFLPTISFLFSFLFFFAFLLSLPSPIGRGSGLIVCFCFPCTVFVDVLTSSEFVTTLKEINIHRSLSLFRAAVSFRGGACCCCCCCWPRVGPSFRTGLERLLSVIVQGGGSSSSSSSTSG